MVEAGAIGPTVITLSAEALACILYCYSVEHSQMNPGLGVACAQISFDGSRTKAASRMKLMKPFVKQHYTAYRAQLAQEAGFVPSSRNSSSAV